MLAILYRVFHPGVRIVITFHGSDVSQHIGSGIHQQIFAAMARAADYTIAVGSDLAKEVREKLGFEPHAIMCAGIDKKTFYIEHGKEKIYDFIFVGSFTEGKGCDMIAEAIRLIGRNDIRYCFAGRGPFKKLFEELSESFHIIIKEKQTQDQLRTLYNQSRFFLLPSRSEAFGLVVTEAMYCGIPALVSNTGGLKDQVVEGVNGFYVQNPDSVKLKDLMVKALSLNNKEYIKLAENAGKSNQNFSLEYVMNKTTEIYTDLTEKKQHNRMQKIVYIMGAGRSGTTLLDIMLGNNPGIFSAGELNRFPVRDGIPPECRTV